MNYSIEKFSKSERVKAESLLARVDNLLDKARQTQEQLYRNFVEVGIALNEVKTSRAWMLRGHSFDAYLMSCQDRFGRKRTSLYSYTAIAETLGGSASAQATDRDGNFKVPEFGSVRKTDK